VFTVFTGKLFGLFSIKDTVIKIILINMHHVDAITDAICRELHFFGTGFSGPVNPQRLLNDAENASLDGIMQCDLDKWVEQFKAAYIIFKRDFSGYSVPSGKVMQDAVEKIMKDIRIARAEPDAEYMQPSTVFLTPHAYDIMDIRMNSILDIYVDKYKSAYIQYKMKVKVNVRGPSIPDGENIQLHVKAKMIEIEIAKEKQEAENKKAYEQADQRYTDEYRQAELYFQPFDRSSLWSEDWEGEHAYATKVNHKQLEADIESYNMSHPDAAQLEELDHPEGSAGYREQAERLFALKHTDNMFRNLDEHIKRVKERMVELHFNPSRPDRCDFFGRGEALKM